MTSTNTNTNKIDSNLHNDKKSNIPSDLLSFLDDDINPIKQVQQFSSLINKASRFNMENNQNRNSNLNIRPLNKNKHSKKSLNNSIMFDKFEDSKLDETKMEESMLFMDFDD